MDLVILNGAMEADIQELFMIIILKVRAPMNGPMVESIQVIGRTIRCTAMVVFHGLMEGTILGNTLLTIKKVMECLNLQTIHAMKGTGKTGNNTARAPKFKIIRRKKGHGKMEK